MDAFHGLPVREDRRSMVAGKISEPSEIMAAGNKAKLIREYVGKVNTGTSEVSIARMKSPQGWREPGQRPDFDEYTIVLEGTLSVTTEDGGFEVGPDEAFIAPRGRWIQYSTPYEGGAEYIAVCVPAFSPQLVHRDPV